jgi:hypothetical protein
VVAQIGYLYFRRYWSCTGNTGSYWVNGGSNRT